MSFPIYSGCGNTFLIQPEDQKTHYAPETDGTIIVKGPNPLSIKIFNRDHSEAEMCGNGVRCVIQYLIDQGIRLPQYEIRAKERLLQASESSGIISVKMGPALEMEKDGDFHRINTGVPHIVRFVEDLETDQLMESAPFYRQKYNANINFATKEKEFIAMRTFERGVEAETLACGTGACAVAVTSGMPSPVKIKTKSGEFLEISFDSTFLMVTMKGTAQKIGEFAILS